MSTAHTDERRVAIQTEIKQLKGRIKRLEAEDKELASPYPRPIRQLVEQLHEIGCAHDHTEGCAWHYDDKRDWPLARGRIRGAQRVQRALDAGWQIEQLQELVNRLPESDVDLAPERVRAPRRDESRLAEGMLRVFRRRYEGTFQWGQGWIRYDSWTTRPVSRWARENGEQRPWSGEQHRRMLGAARAWVRATGYTAAELADLVEQLDAPYGWGA
jgi:hypothetical protein